MASFKHVPQDDDYNADDLIDPDEVADLDDLDPHGRQPHSDREPLTGKKRSSQPSSSRRDTEGAQQTRSAPAAAGSSSGSGNSSAGTRIAQNYLTSSIPGEDRRATTNTIDESVWATVSRDLRAVWEKVQLVLWPKYLLGGILTRGGGGIGGEDSAERGQDSSNGSARPSVIDVGRSVLGRWPDADDILQANMSEGLKNWDLWGPLLFSLVLSLMVSRGAQPSQSSEVFSGVFALVWFGKAIVTAQIKLLGTGNVSFFQALCIIGYTLFPLVLALVLSTVLSLFRITSAFIRIPIFAITILWSLSAGISILGGSGVVKNRVGLAVYPLFVYYIGLGALCFIA